MREKVIELLEFPRRWLAAQMELENCPYDGRYAHGDRRCERCDIRGECQWLFSHGEFLNVHRQPLLALLGSLDRARWLVDARHPWGTHDHNCGCDLCSWRRQTERLLTINCLSHPPA